MGVNMGVATYITILMIVIMAIGFVGQAKQDAHRKNSSQE